MQRLKQQQQQVMIQQALMQQQSLYHPGLLAAPQVSAFSLFFFPFRWSISFFEGFLKVSILLFFFSRVLLYVYTLLFCTAQS